MPQPITDTVKPMTKTINVTDPCTYVDANNVEHAALVQLVDGSNTYDDTGTEPILNIVTMNPDPAAVGPNGRRVLNETGIPHSPSTGGASGKRWFQA